MSAALAPYTLSATTKLDYPAAVEAARSALADEGFGVLCQIDVRATLKAKLDVDREPYVILGACKPKLAHLALELEPELGSLLPCNVIVYVADGVTHVSAIDPERMLAVSGNPDLAPVASEVRDALQRVVEQVAAC